MKKNLRVVKGEEFEVNAGAYDIQCLYFGKLKLKIVLVDHHCVAIQYFKEEHLEAMKNIPPAMRMLANAGPLYQRPVKVNFFERLLGITLKDKMAKKIVRLRKRIIKDGTLYTKRMIEIKAFETKDEV